MLPDVALTQSRDPSEHEYISCASFSASVRQLNKLANDDANQMYLFQGETMGLGSCCSSLKSDGGSVSSSIKVTSCRLGHPGTRTRLLRTPSAAV